MNQESLFPGMKIEPTKQKPLTAAPAKAQINNLPLFTGKPDHAIWDPKEPVTSRLDLRTGKKPQ